jgi:hypothetical protein
VINKFIIIGSVIVVCIWSVFGEETIFEDNFDTDGKWVKAVGSQYNGKAENGIYTVEPEAEKNAFLKHVLPEDQQVSKFTYSVKFSSLSKGVDGSGLLFCWQEDFQGYTFYINHKKEYILGKWVKKSDTRNELEILEAYYFSHINESENILKVSKNGNEISLYCNGIFIYKVSDSQFSKGNIGLYVGQGEKIGFDHATLTNKPELDNPNISFTDSFDNSNLDGWVQLTGSGSIKAESGKLKISVTDEPVHFYTNGKYVNAPCTTIVSYKEGDKNSFYGISYVLMKPNTNINPSVFLINANKYFAVSSDNILIPQSHQAITGKTDTLIVNSQYHFIINGQVVYNKSAQDKGTEFNAIGYYIENNVSVEFDVFKTGYGISHIIKSEKFSLLFNKPSYFLGGMGIIYDSKGRKVATFDDRYYDKLKALGTGPYIIIYKDKKDYIIRRAIINSK